MIVDLHAHYPIHLVPGAPLDAITTAAGRKRLGDRIRARLVTLASRFANYRSFDSGPRVTVDSLRAGGVGVALSVLYSFFDEVDIDEPYGAPPDPDYLPRLVRELELVEEDVRKHHAGEATVVHDRAELDAALADDKVALIHCVEGGFHLGATPEAVDAAVTELARRGVAYVTLAHLFYRRVATNAPAIPFIPDTLYRRLFRQPAEGLSELGRAAVAAMVRERVLVDLSHMSAAAVRDTLELLDELDPAREVPVFASHAGFRFGGEQYMFDAETIERIAARDGVVGVIMAQHQLNDGVRRRRTRTLEESVRVIARHLDEIARITGSHRHAAIGTDFDGFIKPTMGGLENSADLAQLERALRARYGDDEGEAICSGNALRMLRKVLR